MFSRFTSVLFYKIGLLVLVFFALLTGSIFYIIDFYYTDQDTLVDAHDLYFYSELIESWDFPDTNLIKKDLNNLHLSLTIYDYYSYGSKDSSSVLWFFPEMVNPLGLEEFSYSEDLGDSSIFNINYKNNTAFGTSFFHENITHIKKGDYHYFIVINENYLDYSPEWINYVPPIVLSLIFMVGLNVFLQRLLRPIKLMKARIRKLNDGDFKSNIKVMSNDELADLSISINKMIGNIGDLLNQKQQLLLDVSHELRSPLARMRLLVEMLPDHKKKDGLVDEIVFLEGMISNLLFSDKLSQPYSNMEYSNVTTLNLLTKTIDLVNVDLKLIEINNNVEYLKIYIDETKLIIALRNLLDNAIKYGDLSKKILINCFKRKSMVVFEISNFGTTISSSESNDIFEPFFRSEKSKSNIGGFGLGLTITKKIITVHNGSLNFISKNNMTKFIIEIPIKIN